jgi:hypothetical protein
MPRSIPASLNQRRTIAPRYPWVIFPSSAFWPLSPARRIRKRSARTRAPATTNPDGIASAEWVKSGRYEIEIAAERHATEPSLKSFYDPENQRIK